ncbi:hypothetical protein ABE073_17820 [Lederbergia citrisecunda]|uniref:hypothetical protein n=1 Tax=Lederbergia citrisecunda TaxID=2833583 RepID=UPI003D2978B8
MRRIFIIGILALFLVGAGTTIYAKSNSVQNLSDWYKDAFQQKSGLVGSLTAVELVTSLSEFNQFITGSKKSLDAMIAVLFDEKTSDVQSSIEMQHAEMVDELEETVAALQQDKFDEYVDELNIEAELTVEVEKMLEELLNE